jgi:hypothetical protein
MLEVSRLMIRAGLVRQETRGVHVRSDFPQPSDRWRAHIGWRRGRDEPLVEPLATGAGASGNAAQATPAGIGGLPDAAVLGKN